MQDLHKDATYSIESSAKCVLARASHEGRIAVAQGNQALAEHYEMIAYLSRMILEAVDDVAAEVQAAVKK